MAHRLIDASNGMPMLNVPFLMEIFGENYIAVRRAMDGRYEVRNIDQLMLNHDYDYKLYEKDFTDFRWRYIFG